MISPARAGLNNVLRLEPCELTYWFGDGGIVLKDYQLSRKKRGVKDSILLYICKYLSPVSLAP